MNRKIWHGRKGFNVFALIPLPLLLLILVLSALILFSGCAGPFRKVGSSSDFDEESYLFFRAETHANLVTSFSSFESLAGNPLNTPEWERSLKVTIAAIKVICEEIQFTQAPEKYHLSHSYLQSAAADYSRAMDSFMARNPEQMRQYLASGDANYTEAALMPVDNRRTATPWALYFIVPTILAALGFFGVVRYRSRMGSPTPSLAPAPAIKTLTIGRDPGNGFIIDDPDVSRVHAQIEYKSGHYWLTDFNSTNGTMVDGNPVQGTVELKPSSEVCFGNSSFHFDGKNLIPNN